MPPVVEEADEELVKITLIAVAVSVALDLGKNLIRDGLRRTGSPLMSMYTGSELSKPLPVVA